MPDLVSGFGFKVFGFGVEASPFSGFGLQRGTSRIRVISGDVLYSLIQILVVIATITASTSVALRVQGPKS